MARHVREEHLRAIEEILREHTEGTTVSQIETALTTAPPRRTLQYRLKSLVDSKRITMVGTGRGARYRLPRQLSVAAHGVSWWFAVLPVLSGAGAEIREYVRQPPAARRPVGYDRTL